MSRTTTKILSPLSISSLWRHLQWSIRRCEEVITTMESVLGAFFVCCLYKLHQWQKTDSTYCISLYLRARVRSRPRSCPTSRSPTCPSSPTSSRRRCSPPSSTTKSCPSGRRRSRCSASLTLASTRRASTTSVLPASDHPATRGAPSSRSLVSSAGRGVSAQACLSVA